MTYHKHRKVTEHPYDSHGFLRCLVRCLRLVALGMGFVFLLIEPSGPLFAAAPQILGPSFPCPEPRDPLAQLICGNPGLWRVDLSFVQVYQALRQQLSPDGQQALRQESLEFGLAVRKACGIALAQSPDSKLPPPPAAPPGAISCVASAYQRERFFWQSRLTGPAAEEAAMPITDLITAQTNLKRLGFLASDQAPDGVFGTTTRAAITLWQTAVGRTATGLLDNAEAQLLAQETLKIGDPDDPAYRAALQEAPRTIFAVASGGQIDATDSDGSTALKRTVSVGHNKAAAWLLSQRADPNVQDHSGASSLDAAAALGNRAMVRALLSAGARFWTARGDQALAAPEQALFIAVVRGDRAGVQAALDAGAAVNQADSGGFTPLHFAAALPDDTIAMLLLVHGAAVNATSRARTTPLMLATESNAVLLLALGADVAAAGPSGLTALHFAAFFGQEGTLQLLLAHGADPSSQDKDGRTALGYAEHSQYGAYSAPGSDLRARMVAELQAASAGQRPRLTPAQTQHEQQLKQAVESGAHALQQARLKQLQQQFGADANAVMHGQVLDGMSTEAVTASRGAPQQKLAIAPIYQVWVYPAARIAFTNGKVTHVGH